MSTGFLQLKNRYLLTGRLEVCAPLHVGSGFEDTDQISDAGFIRDAAGPFIPGSSIRGVLRSTLERVMQSLGDPKRGCVLFIPDSHPTCPTAWKDDDKRKEKLEQETDDRALMKALLAEDAGLCDLCRLFGSPFMASKLRFVDARPVAGGVRINKRDGVGIDRDTESAREKIKFDFMAMERSVVDQNKQVKPLELTFEAQLENAEDSDLALLGIMLRELVDRGIDVGGKKSRGFGRVKLRDYRIQYFDDRTSLKCFLATGKLKEMTGGEFDALLEAKLEAYFKTNYREGEDAQTVGQ